MRARWTKLALSESPVARSSHKLSAIDGKAYLFGGESTARQSIDSTIHCFGKGSDGWKWQRLEPASSAAVPPARVGHAQTVVQTKDGPKLVIFGGRAGVEMGEQELGDLWSFAPPSRGNPHGRWTQLEAASAPSARSFHAAASWGSELFIFGGCGASGRMADLHAYDAATNRWRELPPPPPDLAGRGGATLEAASSPAAAAAAARGRSGSEEEAAIWLACGFAGHETNDLLRFCLRTESWRRAPSDASWLRPRSVVASFAFPAGPLVLFGGEVSPSDRGHEGAGGFAGDLVAIAGEEGAPLDVAVEDGPAPAPRGWAAATALSPSQGLLFGGLTGTDDAPERLGDSWLLEISKW